MENLVDAMVPCSFETEYLEAKEDPFLLVKCSTEKKIKSFVFFRYFDNCKIKKYIRRRPGQLACFAVYHHQQQKFF